VQSGWILNLVLLGILHWLLAGIVLNDIAGREKVVGGHKAFWVILAVLVTFVGSCIYLLFHPDIMREDE
jgi:hypothetical protein